jgi:hypothetical protein
MPSGLLPPLDALIIAMSVAFAVSTVIGVIVGRARLRRSAHRPGPAAPDEGVVGTPVMGPESPGAVAAAESPLASRRWEDGGQPLLPRRGTRPG